jgi:hypothetical protein
MKYKKFTENKDELKFAYEIIYAFFYFYFNIKYDVSLNMMLVLK